MQAGGGCDGGRLEDVDMNIPASPCVIMLAGRTYGSIQPTHHSSSGDGRVGLARGDAYAFMFVVALICSVNGPVCVNFSPV